jgi:hypothetical protein
MKAAGVLASILIVATAGCSHDTTAAARHNTRTSGRKATPTAQSSAHPSVPLTGTKLSSLVPAPPGFTLNRAASSDTGSRRIAPVTGPDNMASVSCGNWEAGKAYFYPGPIGNTERHYSGHRSISLDIFVSVYASGVGARDFDAGIAVERRCRNFAYKDKDGLPYAVSNTIGPPLGLGDQSGVINQTLTGPNADSYTTQTTFIQVGDAVITVTETGPKGSPVNRAALPLAAIVAALRSAGY